jgi:hypothetical protein
MPRTKRDDPAELLRLALVDLDTRIAELQETRAQLTAMIDRQPADAGLKAAAPRKRRKLSAEARAKISDAARARWAREKKAQAKALKPKPIARKAKTKAKPTKARLAPGKAKRKKV